MFIEFLRQRQLHPDPAEGGTNDEVVTKEFIPLGDIDAEEEVLDETRKADLEKAAADKAAKDKAEPTAEELAEKAEEDRLAAEQAAKKVKTKTDPPPVIEDEPEDDDEGSFWEDVDKLRGETLDVDFGETDPNSPEGALLYEKAIREDELTKFEQHLKDNHPRAYAYMTHIMDGGKEEDFFKLAGEPGTLPTEEELDADVDRQKDIVTRNLKAKGNTDKTIERIIKSAIIEDDLVEMSKDALKEEDQRQKAALRSAEENSAKEVAERQRQIDSVSTYVKQVAETGKLDNIIIPEKDRLPFAKAVTNSIRYENGKFLVVSELNQDTAMKVLKEKFFSYKDGDLGDLISKAARTENTRRLQRTTQTTQKKPLASGEQGNTSFVSLGEMEE